MVRSIKYAVIFSIVVTVSGCASLNAQQKALLATTVGGAVGAVVGNQIGSGSGRVVATLVGGALGAYLGNRLASYLSQKEQRQVAGVVEDQLQKPGSASSSKTWHSDDGQKSVEVATTPSFDKSKAKASASRSEVDVQNSAFNKIPPNAPCRYSTNRLSVNGDPAAESKVLYCRTSNGNWVAVGAKSGDIVAAL